MKIIRRILLIIVIIIGLIIIVSFFLPNKIHVERTKLIDAPVHIVFNQVNDLHKWDKWSPWNQIDTAMEKIYFGEKRGEGAGFEWKSEHPNVGNGKMLITSSVLLDSVKTEMDFGDQGTAIAYHVFNETDSGTNVKWSFDTELGGNPIAKFMGLMMDKWIGADYEKGLINLNNLCKVLPAYEIKEKEIETIPYISIKSKCLNEEIGQKYAEAYGELMNFIMENELEVKDDPICIYYSYDSVQTEFEAAIPVSDIPKLKGNIKAGEIQAGKYIKTTHYGPYDQLIDAYEALNIYMDESGLKMAGFPWEKYKTDPQNEPDSRKWITKIYFPVQVIE
ncbi:GyrI-like domain-containing protein [Bacteroidota bacterium]